MKQLELDYQPEATDRNRESQSERCRRLLAGDLRQHVRPASELLFDYTEATRQHVERVVAFTETTQRD